MPAIGTHILVSLCYHVESEKKMAQTILFTKQKRDTDVEYKCMDTKRERVGDEMNWEIGTDIKTLLILCIKQIINEYSTENSTQCSVVT